MILVIDIGNTNIKFTGIDNHPEKSDRISEKQDFSVLFETRLSTESGKDIPVFLREAKELLGEHGISFLTEKMQPEAALPETELPDDTQPAAALSETEPPENIQPGAALPETEAYEKAQPQAALSDTDLSGQKVEAVAISSVVPADTPAAISLAEKICPRPPVVISCRCDSGLSFDGLPAPERVGADRIADAARAAARYPLPAMTVDLGTATTINVIAPPEPDDKGKTGIFLGGMIGAGVLTSLHALRTGTAQLPELLPREVPAENLIGIDTDGCMLSSAIVGTAAMIEGLASRVEEQLGRPVTLILTGGNARFVAPWIRRPFINEPGLAPLGAAVIALRELSGK